LGMEWYKNRAAYVTYLSDLRYAGAQLDLSSFEDKSVFVSGANGLIGSCIADMLLCLSQDKNLNVNLILGARRPESLKDRFQYWEGKYEPFQYDAMASDLPPEDLDFVFHCASNAHPRAYAEQPVETAMTNVLGTSYLLSKLANDGHGRLIYVSSSEVYGRRSSSDLYSEDDCFPIDSLDPRSCYPLSKRMSENLCAGFASEYKVDSVIVRPGHIYGPTQTPHDSRAHAQFARAAAEGRAIVMKSAGSQFRSYCYMADCSSAMIFAALHGKSGEAFNISNPDSDCTIAQLASAFAKAGGVDLIHEQADEAEKRGYARMDNSAVDSSKLRGLGWTGKFSLELGSRRTVELLRSGI